MAKSSTKAKQPAAKDDTADKPAVAKPAEQQKPAEKPKAAPKAKPAAKPKAKAKPAAGAKPAPKSAPRTGMPQPGDTVIMHSPNPINGRMSNPAKVIRHNDKGRTLALEVEFTTGASQIFNSVGNVEQPGQQWWRWPNVDESNTAA